jgi:hypothetical protein
MTFEIGEFVEIVCHDGKTFAGWLEDFTPDYLVLTGPRGFPHADVLAMQHA